MGLGARVRARARARASVRLAHLHDVAHDLEPVLECRGLLLLVAEALARAVPRLDHRERVHRRPLVRVRVRLRLRL